MDFRGICEQIFQKDGRYKPDSYQFIMEALHWTQNKLKRQGHVSGKELSQGCAEYAIDQYGPMARTVLNHWGITSTRDFGNIVYNMIEHKMCLRNESDSLDDFKDIYDFDSVFANVLSDSAPVTRLNKKKFAKLKENGKI